MAKLVYVVVRDVVIQGAAGYTEILQVFEEHKAAGHFAQAQCDRNDLKHAARILGVNIRHRVLGRELC